MSANVVRQTTGGTGNLGSTGNISVSFGSLPSAGSSIVLCVSEWQGVGFGASPTVSDNQGNSYTRKGVSTTGTKGRASIWIAENIGTPGGTFTVTYSHGVTAQNTYGAVRAIEVTGLESSSSFDVTASNSAASSSNPASADSGTTATTAQADELAVAAMLIDGWVNPAGIATPSGYSVIYEVQDGASYVPCAAHYKVLSSAGTQQASYGSSINPTGGSGAWAACIATFKAAAGSSTLTIGSDAGSRRNRPGRGPYSHGRYYRATDWLGSFLVGAQTYSVSVAETGSAGDTVAAQVQLGASLTESGAAADVLSTVATFLRAVAEAATATDDLTTTAIFPRSVTETGSASDIVSSGAATYSVDLAEIATAAETLAALLNAGAALTESSAAADTVASIGALLAALTETVTAADAQSSSLGSGTYSVQVTEAASALDSLGALVQWSRAMAEAGGASDTVAALGTFGALVAEAATAVDTLVAGGITNVSLSEAGSATDQVSAPTGFGETPDERVITVRYGNRVIHVGARSGPIRVLN